LTGRGDYIQPSIQSIKLRNTLPALRSNDLFRACYLAARAVEFTRTLP
jgi:hypothetical protein